MASSPLHAAHHVHDVTVALDRAIGIDAHAARGRDPAEIVARQIDQHHVLGIFLGIGEQLDLEPLVERRSSCARPRAGDRTQLRFASVELDQRLRR